MKKEKKTDAFINTYNKLGINDNVTRATFSAYTRFSQTECEDYFGAHWINRNAVTIIPEDLFRQGVSFKHDDIKVVENVHNKLEELEVIDNFLTSCILSRIYGGSLLILGIVDGRTPEQPVNTKAIKNIEFLHPIDRFKVRIKTYYTDPLKPNFNKPELYEVTNKEGKTSVIHESRVLRFDGDYLPESLAENNQGWYDSIYVSIQDSLKQYCTAMSSGATLFVDFITKVIKIPNLMDLVQRGKTGDNAIDKRIALASSKIANHNIVAIGEGEEFSKIATAVAGLKELMDLYIEAVCGSIKVPRTRLLGQQLGVLAGADEQTRTYYDVVKAYGNKHVKKQFETFLKYLLQAMFSKEPDSWAWEFNPLWQDSQKSLLEQRKIQADIDGIYLSQGVVTPEEIAVSRFTERGYSFDTHIEMELRENDGGEGTTKTPDSE